MFFCWFEVGRQLFVTSASGSCCVKGLKGLKQAVAFELQLGSQVQKPICFFRSLKPSPSTDFEI